MVLDLVKVNANSIINNIHTIKSRNKSKSEKKKNKKEFAFTIILFFIFHLI